MSRAKTRNPILDKTGAVPPKLRGWLHVFCFFLAIPTGITVILLADSTRARVGAAVYAVGLVALFGVSGFYHRGRWSPTWRSRMRRLDHSTIFVMVAGSYTPVCLVVLEGWVSAVMLISAWVGAAIGAVLAWTNRRWASVARGALYIVLGWGVVIALPQLIRGMTVAELVLIVAGGVLFTLGAITLATKWPDPFPQVFGNHEVWHTFVVVAVVCHFIAIASVVSTTTAA
ncbi:MAG: PAQR family membrane homeostasis protein TrhA [Acidimicrobiales bacterium]